MRKILFVCLGNIARSPMAEAIFNEMIKELGLEEEISADSAGLNPVYSTPTFEARETIKKLYGKDLLANHRSKSLAEVNLEDYDLILTMTRNQKHGLPKGKTYTLREFAGLEGDIEDPYGQNMETYMKCALKIKESLEKAISRIIRDCLGRNYP